MPIEVINLLSSPDLPRISASKPKRPAGPATALTFGGPNEVGYGSFERSKVPASTQAIAGLPGATTRPIKDLNSSSKCPVPALSKNTITSGDDFFLSDDFDNTINLDDSFNLDIPAAKKPRLSPSRIAPPNTALSKTKSSKGSISISMPDRKPSSKTYAAQNAAAMALRQPKTTTAKIPASDPLIFTSSPDPILEVSRRRKQKRKERLYEEDDEDIFRLETPRHKETEQGVTRVLGASQGNTLRGLSADNSSNSDLPDLNSIPMKNSSNTYKDSRAALDKYNGDKVKQKTTQQKAEAVRDRLASKEAKKQWKKTAKEEKTRKKETDAELARVNTLRTDKKISTPDMIVELPSALDSQLAEQVRRFLSPLDVTCSDWESLMPVIKWMRKVEARFDDNLGYWIPTPIRIEPEKHILCVLDAKDFVELVTGDEGSDLEAHVLQLKVKFEHCKIIYLIEGLVLWIKKNQLIPKRRFDEAVRSQMAQEEPSASQRKRKKKAAEYVDQDKLEDALLRLQVIHGMLIHHTAARIETAEWIVTFTQHISTIPSRLQKEALDTAFCMESGQVKTGENPADTFTKMLQEMTRITLPIAYGIAAEYPSVQKLVKGLQERGPLALEDCRKMANMDGAFTDKRIGQSISKRVYHVFMGTDPGSWDV